MGDLWDGGWGLETNEETVLQPHPRLDAWWAVNDVAALAAIADLDEALAEWAGEAMIADADGFWIGRHNFFLYDHPTRGWIWIPHDLDATIDWVDVEVDPLYYWGREATWSGPWPHYAAVIEDPGWRDRYVAALQHAYDVFVAGEAPGHARSLRGPGGRRRGRRSDAAVQRRHPRGGGAVAPGAPCTRAARSCARGSLAGRRPRARPTPTVTAHPFCADCNDGDANARPGATEICRGWTR